MLIKRRAKKWPLKRSPSITILRFNRVARLYLICILGEYAFLLKAAVASLNALRRF